MLTSSSMSTCSEARGWVCRIVGLVCGGLWYCAVVLGLGVYGWGSDMWECLGAWGYGMVPVEESAACCVHRSVGYLSHPAKRVKWRIA